MAGSSIGASLPSPYAHAPTDAHKHTVTNPLPPPPTPHAPRTAGGAIASLVYRQLLSSLGLRAALGVFAGVHAVAFAAGYAMMAERRPARARAPLVWFDRAFFRDGVFWSLAGCFFFTVLCVFFCLFSFLDREGGLRDTD